jgi:C4-dicarboxylate-specific signal transduction histidine kinase
LLKQNSASRGIRIVLLTARTDEEAKLKALKSGADDFVTKPFSSAEILTRLMDLYRTAQLERDLEKRNEEVKEALSRLKSTQAQLIQSEKINALGSLAAGLLHEINNPLNYSLTALQLIREDNAVRQSDLLKEVIGDIEEGMQRIQKIISDLRSFAYPSESEIQASFDLAEAVESALRFTSHELKGIAVKIDLPEGILVVGSKSHITQVFVNLFANSAKAIQEVLTERVGEIRVTAKERDGRLVVRIEDNGAGMDEKTLGRAFDPFFTTRDVGQGMGLGLSVCHTIISNHGGRMEAKSKRGEGAELTFDLPLSSAIPVSFPERRVAV